MDLNAFLALGLPGLVFALVEFVKLTFPKMSAQVTQLVVFVIGVGTALLYGQTPFAAHMTVGGVSFASTNLATQAFVGLAVAALATVGDHIKTTVMNIGQNQPDPAAPPAPGPATVPAGEVTLPG